MKKTLLLFGFVCALSVQSMALANIPASRHGAICVLDDDDDEMSEEELRALMEMSEVEPSALQQWVAGKAGIVLGWYMNYRRYIRKLALLVSKRKRSKRRV